jgi:hypothetical protein
MASLSQADAQAIPPALVEEGRHGQRRRRNPAASVAKQRGAEAKGVFQDKAARLAGQRRVVVVVTVAVAVAGHIGRADRRSELDAGGWQTKEAGRR